MPISYTKEQWSSLSIQDRIKAMNSVVEQDEDEVLQVAPPESPAPDELPKRTSVVDMWRQRENPTTISSAKPVVKNFRTSPAQINSESDAASKDQTTHAPKKTWNQGKIATSSWPTSAFETASATPSWKKPSKLAHDEPIADLVVTSTAEQEKDASQQLGPKIGGIQQSWNQQKSTKPSWQQPDITKSSVTSEPRLWQKPLVASTAEMQDKFNVSTIGEGESPEETPMATSISIANKWEQKSKPSQPSWSQRNGSNPPWQKPAVKSTAEGMVKPGAAQTQTPILASSFQKPTATSPSNPRDWKNSLRQTSSSASVATSASWQKPEEAGNIISSSPRSNVTDSRHKLMPVGILGQETKKRANISIDMNTKDEVDKSRIHEDSTQDNLAPGEDATHSSDASSVMNIWKKRELLSAQPATPMSPLNRNLSRRKPPIILAAKRAPFELQHPAAAPDETDNVRHGVTAVEKNEPPLSKQSQRSENDTLIMDPMVVGESVRAELDWPIADESEYVEQPAATGHTSLKRASKSSIFEKWKKRQSGANVVVDESNPSPVNVGETQNEKISGSSTDNFTNTSRSFDLSSKPTSTSGGEATTVKSDLGSRSKALEFFKQKQKQQNAEEKTINNTVRPSLIGSGNETRLETPLGSGSVEEKKDGDDVVILVADEHARVGGSTLEDQGEGKPISSTGMVVERTKDFPNSGLVRISNRPTTRDADSINAVSGFIGKSNKTGILVSKAITMENPGLENQLSPRSPSQIIESPSQKLSRTVEKKRVQEHRQRLRQIRHSDQSVSSVETTPAFESDSVSQAFSDTEPNHFETAKYSTNDENNKKSKLARSEYPYSPPTDYAKVPMFEKMNPMFPEKDYTPPDEYGRQANLEVGPFSRPEPSALMKKKGMASRPLPVQIGQSAFSSPTTSGFGAFSLYSREKSEDSPSPLASPSASSIRSFSYRSTNRYKHKKELAARGTLTSTGYQQPSNMSDTGQSDTALSFVSASTGYSARSVNSIKSTESEESNNFGSSTLASRANLMLKSRRNKLFQNSPEEERSAKDLYRRMLEGQSNRQQPYRRDRTAAYAPSHRGNANGDEAEFKKAQREGLSSRYNSSSRFTDASTSQGPVSHNFRGGDHPKKTYSFGSQASENSSNLYSPSSRSERSDGSDPWVGGVSTDGTRADENEIGGFDELQSAYRDLDLAQMAIDLKEEVQTSLKGSVQEVTAMVSKLLTSPVNPLLSPSRDVKNPSKNRMKTPKRAETEDEEIAIEVQYIGEVDDDAQSAGEIEKANSNSRSYSSKSFTRHGGAAGQRSDEQGEQAARRGLV